MAKAAKTTTAMTTAKETSLSAGFDSLQKMAAFSEEMDGLSAVFEQIKIPIGGVTYFEMPGEDPEQPETAKEFSAVILYHHPMRAYYKEKYTGGNNPPDCGSMDAVEGTGEPGGDCNHSLHIQPVRHGRERRESVQGAAAVISASGGRSFPKNPFPTDRLLERI